jgi:hypothetical protein
VHGDSTSGNLGVEGFVITRISFAYFGGKRKEEGEERKKGRERITQRRGERRDSQRKGKI